MWTYEQSTGRLFDPTGKHVGTGYSGAPQGRNNTLMQAIRNVGPIPLGLYTFGSPIDTLTHGKHVLPLRPYSTNNMFGRSGFLIHGDSVIEPGTASEGCIIMPLAIREELGVTSDKQLQVVETHAVEVHA